MAASGRADMGGGRGDLQQLVNRLPTATLSDFQKGDAVMVVSTQGTDSGGVTAITLLGGVEAILAAAPAGNASQAMLLRRGVSARQRAMPLVALNNSLNKPTCSFSGDWMRTRALSFAIRATIAIFLVFGLAGVSLRSHRHGDDPRPSHRSFRRSCGWGIDHCDHARRKILGRTTNRDGVFD